jgi:hypothetical protein
MAAGSELAEFVTRFGSSSGARNRRKAMNAGASACFIKGVECSEFLAGIKAAAESTN